MQNAFIASLNILRRYTLKEVFVPFLMTICLFTFIFLTGSIVKMADTVLNKGVGLSDMLKILGLALPEVFSFTLPTSALAAVVLALGSFSQNNELRAMKATGINPLTIMIPVLMAAFILSVFAFVFNDQIVTSASFEKRKLVKKILFKNPSSIFEPNRFVKDFKGYIFHVKGVSGNRLDQVIIYQPQEEQPTRTIIAERGEIVASPDGGELVIKLFNGTIDEPGKDELYKLDFETYSMPPISVESAAKIQKKPRELRLDELLWQLREDNYQDEKEKLRDRTELQRRFSFSLATFVFVLVGLPTAVLVRRGELIWSFGISMTVVIAYYVLYVWAGTIANYGFIPPEVALWFPNFVLMLIGIFLIKKAVES
ncbi:MAG: LptF/LptG family permease [Candidatus Omnitrophica bacterium]|nr:LptF/LptG family permease [Candidatus Omnitrophota bacterium]